MKIPDEIKKELAEKMKIPEGTFHFKVTFEKSIYEQDAQKYIIFEHIAGLHYFRIERTEYLKIKFYHSSPGTGTRMAVVDISNSKPSPKVMFVFTWASDKIKLFIGPIGVDNGKLEESIEEISDRDFKITQDGTVVESGSPYIGVMGLRINENGLNVLDNSAIESWSETLQAIDILMAAKSEDGYMFDVVKSNFTIVALVTGIETYCKRRLQELEKEGITLHYEDLKQNANLTKEEIFSETTSYFQNLGHMKNIWKNLVDIDVYKLEPVIWQIFKEKLFPHRHVVIHAHTMRSEIKSPKNELIFVTNELSNLKDSCVDFIKNLHSATLNLK